MTIVAASVVPLLKNRAKGAPLQTEMAPSSATARSLHLLDAVNSRNLQSANYVFSDTRHSSIIRHTILSLTAAFPFVKGKAAVFNWLDN